MAAVLTGGGGGERTLELVPQPARSKAIAQKLNANRHLSGSRRTALAITRNKSRPIEVIPPRGIWGKKCFSMETACPPVSVYALTVSIAEGALAEVVVVGFTAHPMLAEDGAQDKENGALKPSTAVSTTGTVADWPERIAILGTPSVRENVPRSTFTVAGALVEGL